MRSWFWLLLGARALALHPPHFRPHVRPRARPCAAADDGDGPEYLNKFTQLLGRLLPATDAAADTPAAAEASALDEIEWTAPKRRGLSLDAMCAELDHGLREREWFVTGLALPQLFSDDFYFKDPDVALSGIEPYARGVRRLFDQATARAEIVRCAPIADDTIEVLWRLSGKVSLGSSTTVVSHSI